MRSLAVARCVRGIERLVAAEIHEARMGRVRETRHREVWFEPVEHRDPTGLRTADDVLLVAAIVDGIGPTRAALPRLSAAARAVSFSSLESAVRGKPARSAAHSGAERKDSPVITEMAALGAGGFAGIEVSASFVGRRNYSRYEIEDAVGHELARRARLPYHSRAGGTAPPPGCAAFRVTVEGERAVIGLRVAARPLHRRPYKTASIPGTLHPPLAAAMAGLARLEGARTVLDPCCGAGTTLIEAASLAPGARLLGVDRNPAAVEAARVNGAGCPVTWAVGDAGRLPVPTGGVDRVLVNPPWGRQVPPAGSLAGDPARLWRELRRVLVPGGLAVALLHGDDGGVPPGFVRVGRLEVSLFGRRPALAVLRRASRGRAG
jgi:tRNA (guanine6-N2)-methyltransferase